MFNLLSHNDTAKADDAFKQQAFIKQVCDLIKDCQPPKGIGINGYWGTGKTSTLMQIHKELTGISPYEDDNAITNNEDIIPIWFEAWCYQSETVPIVALLQEIRAQISNWQKYINGSKKLGSIALLGIFGAIDAALKVASGGILSPNISKIPELGRQWEADHRETPLASQDLRKLLEQAVDQALNKKEGDTAKRLVIFIDDLDRCLPKVALQLLEGIKVYLNLNNCVLVFGMDQRQIEEALGSGSRYFCESFYGHPCPTSGKSYATANACGCPSRPASFVGYPARGIQHHSRNDSTRCRKACIFTTQKALRENTCPIASGDYSTPVSQRKRSIPKTRIRHENIWKKSVRTFIICRYLTNRLRPIIY